jgi:hypothetical protein
MRETSSAKAHESSGGSTAEESWLEELKAVGQRLREGDLVSPEQVELLDSLAREVGQLGLEKSAETLPLLSLAFSAMEFERLARHQAQAAGTVARVRSAVPLTKEERTILKERLRERFREEFILRTWVDPSLIGGLVIEAKGQIIDGSVSSRLEALKERMLAALEERESHLPEPQRSGEKE